MERGYLFKDESRRNRLVVRKVKGSNYFEIDAGFSIKYEIHRNRLPSYCAPELIASLEKSEEVECIIVTREKLDEYKNALDYLHSQHDLL